MSIQRYRRIRITDGNHLYLDVELEFHTTKKPQVPLDEQQLRLLILTSISSLFGEAAYSIQFDIIKYRSTPAPRAYIRVLGRDYVRFRIALSLTSQCINPSCGNKKRKLEDDDKEKEEEAYPCQFIIYKACHSLASLPVVFNIEDHIEDGGK